MAIEVGRLALRYVSTRTGTRELAQTTARTTRYTLAGFARAVPDDPRQVRRTHVEHWLAGQNVGAGTLRTRLGSVRVFCRWMVLGGWMRADPTLGIRGPRKPRTVPRAFNNDEVTAALDACPDARARLMLSLMLCEGLRRAEVAGLQIGDFDTRDWWVIVRGKGDKERVLPVTPATQVALRTYLGFFPASSGPLLRSYQYERRALSPGHVGRVITDLLRDSGVKVANLDGRTPHAFRHTCASDVLDAGADIWMVKELLGHESIETTQIYLRRASAESLRVPMTARSYASPLRSIPTADRPHP